MVKEKKLTDKKLFKQFKPSYFPKDPRIVGELEEKMDLLENHCLLHQHQTSPLQVLVYYEENGKRDENFIRVDPLRSGLGDISFYSQGKNDKKVDLSVRFFAERYFQVRLEDNSYKISIEGQC